MDFKNILNNLDSVEYSEKITDEFSKKLSGLKVDASYYLLLLVGPYQKGKKKFLTEIFKKTSQKITNIDLAEIITMSEKETIQNIDSLIESLEPGNRILLFSNADRLCGAYTGYTYSSHRYATPQERYFLKKILKIEKIILLDIADPYNVDATMMRHAHQAIIFDKPTSILSKLTWNLGNVTFHGHEFETKRPS